MALDWSSIITGILSAGASILALIKSNKNGNSNDPVSNSGFWLYTSSGTPPKVVVNPIIYLVGGAILLFLLLRRKK